MQDAYIVSALRTPIGKKKGSLSSMHPADLGAAILSATFDRVDLDPGLVEDVIFGCVDTVGPQAGDIARTCWPASSGNIASLRSYSINASKNNILN